LDQTERFSTGWIFQASSCEKTLGRWNLKEHGFPEIAETQTVLCGISTASTPLPAAESFEAVIDSYHGTVFKPAQPCSLRFPITNVKLAHAANHGVFADPNFSFFYLTNRD